MNHLSNLPTIAALATPSGIGAIHIIRLSGSKAYQIINKICLNIVRKPTKNSIQLTKIIDGFYNVVDHVLLVKFKSPHSFTGEDLIEINCHGSMLIVQLILELLIKNGATIAQKGDFSKRAFLSNKIDLIQAEAILSLIHATSQNQIQVAVANLDKRLSSQIEKIIDLLFNLIAECEISIDYPEINNYHQIDDQKIKKKLINGLNEIIFYCEKILKNSNTKKIKNFRVAIIGRINAGKSSLINAIVKSDRMIVSDIPGTTRDIVEIDYYLNGRLITFVDTAGINNTSNDKIEALGINKTYQEIDQADLLIHLIDGTNLENSEDQKINSLLNLKKFIKVYSKKDLVNFSNLLLDQIYISSKNNDLDELYNAIEKHLKTDEIDSTQVLGLCSSNGIENLALALDEIKMAKANLENKNDPIDLVLENLNLSYDYLIKITDLADDDLINKIFSNFCVGK